MSQNVLTSQNYVIKLILEKTFGPSWRCYEVVKWRHFNFGSCTLWVCGRRTDSYRH